VISNAGCETVAAADQTGSGPNSLELASLTEPTVTEVRKLLEHFKLSDLQEVRNPMDLTPMANDRAHIEVLKAFHADPNVDILVHACIPMTSAIKAIQPDHPEGYAQLLMKATRSDVTKPVVAVLDAGALYEPLANALFEAGIPVFRSIDRALLALTKLYARDTM
jgi:acyl-CoA synthetase (NDP forming)